MSVVGCVVFEIDAANESSELARLSAEEAGGPDPLVSANHFYREELFKHRQCLEQQREYYSEKAITDVETALTRLIADVDRLCARKDGDQLVSRLLRKIDGVTRLSAWSDPKKHH